MAALLKPFGNCAELLNKSIVLPLLSKCIERSVNYVKSIKDGDLKNKVPFISSSVRNAINLFLFVFLL